MNHTDITPQQHIPRGTDESASLAFARRTLIAMGVAVSVFLVLAFLWYAADFLLLVFGGVLLAVLWRGLARLVRQWTRLGWSWSLIIVTLLFLAVGGAVLWLVTERVSAQIDTLAQQLPQAVDNLRAYFTRSMWLQSLGHDLPGVDEWLGGRRGVLARITKVTINRIGRRLLASVVVWLFTLATAQGQALEEDETETIQPSAARSAQGARAPDRDQVALMIINQTNTFRQEEGRQQVAVHPQLRQTAQDFAHFMARTDIYSHTADGHRPIERARQHGYTACIVSENIASHFSTTAVTAAELAQQLVQGWQQSPGHRKNMLDPDVTETGVAIAQSKKSGTVYAVHMFGRPRSQRLTFQIANRSPAVIDYALGERTLPLPPGVTRTHRRCRPVEITLRWPDAQAPTTVLPPNGARYTIRKGDSGVFTIKSGGL